MNSTFFFEKGAVMKKQFDERNLTMVMDFYELTMANGYFKDEDKERKVAFDVFYRKNPDNAGYAIFAGLEQIIEYIENLHFDEDDIEYLRGQGLFGEEFLAYLADFKFRGDIYSFPEGTIMYPNEPVITVVAPLLDAQLVETAILLQVNHQSLIATKTRRIVRSAKGRAVSDFGARRAHNMDAAVYGARAAYIGGAVGTATVLAGQMFNIPISGTMAHSWVMFYRDEFEAFKHYAENYPDATVLLVDTYDVVKSGIPNAIRCAKEVLEPMGKRLKGIRLDSGDLAYLSKKVRKMLDDAGLTDCKIVVSNSLDEWTIMSILEQGGCLTADNRNSVFNRLFFNCIQKFSPACFQGMKIFCNPVIYDHFVRPLSHLRSSRLLPHLHQNRNAHLPGLLPMKGCSLQDLLHLLLLSEGLTDVFADHFLIFQYSDLRSFVLFLCSLIYPRIFRPLHFPTFRSVFEGSPWKSWKY